jgi:RNA 2',3'-cyclic 3'-phosphodiesterase
MGRPQPHVSGLGKERLFLAAALDDGTRSLLAAHLREHGGPGLPGRVVDPSGWHVTLRFLGWATDVQRDGILRSVDEGDLPAPFVARFDGFGAFPKARRAGILWVGFDRGGDELAAMAAVCEAAARQGGFEPVERPFVPHVTLSRIRPHQDVTALLARLPPFPVTMPVRAVTLYRSTLRPGGAVYDVVDTVELR